LLPPSLRPKPQDLKAAAKELEEIQEAISFLRDIKGEGHAQIMARLAPVADNSSGPLTASSPSASQQLSHLPPAFDYPQSQEHLSESTSASDELFSQSTSALFPTAGLDDFGYIFDGLFDGLDLGIAEEDNA
jgi:hypothetical protein